MGLFAGSLAPGEFGRCGNGGNLVCSLRRHPLLPLSHGLVMLQDTEFKVLLPPALLLGDDAQEDPRPQQHEESGQQRLSVHKRHDSVPDVLKDGLVRGAVGPQSLSETTKAVFTWKC